MKYRKKIICFQARKTKKQATLAPRRRKQATLAPRRRKPATLAPKRKSATLAPPCGSRNCGSCNECSVDFPFRPRLHPTYSWRSSSSGWPAPPRTFTPGPSIDRYRHALYSYRSLETNEVLCLNPWFLALLLPSHPSNIACSSLGISLS
jgi:hypothetical protein